MKRVRERRLKCLSVYLSLSLFFFFFFFVVVALLLTFVVRLVKPTLNDHVCTCSFRSLVPEVAFEETLIYLWMEASARQKLVLSFFHTLSLLLLLQT